MFIFGRWFRYSLLYLVLGFFITTLLEPYSESKKRYSLGPAGQWPHQNTLKRTTQGYLQSTSWIFSNTMKLRDVFKKLFRFSWCLQSKTPSDPSLCVLLCEKKLTPIFLVGNWVYDCQNTFYAWSHQKIYLFCPVSCGLLFPRIDHLKEPVGGM